MSTKVATQKGAQHSVAAAGPSFFLEGWFILLLGAFSAGLVGAVAGAYAVGTDSASMATLATAGYLVGYVLARTEVPDLFAHAFTFLLGIVVSLVAIDPSLLWRQLRAGEWRLALGRYETLLHGFLDSLDAGERFDTEVAVFAIGLTMWLIGYTAAWMLFRRGWIFWSLALPGSILLVTLALERDRPSWPALLYLGLALAMAAGHTTVKRSAFWRSRSIAQPATLGRRSILIGSAIAALAVGVGLFYSFDLDDRFQQRAVEGGDRVANWVTDHLDRSSSGPSEPLPVAGNYGAFAGEFKVGDGVPTGDTPIVIVQADGEEYLVARRMNEYDGSGWRSTSSATGNETTPASRIAYQSDQPMNMPRDQLQHRLPDQASIVIIQPTDRLLFTIDQHSSASLPTLVRVGWELIDKTYQIGTTDLSEVPVDLRELIVLLQSADFSDASSTDVPQPADIQDQAELERIRNWLMESYPVATELSWGPDGAIQVHLQGRLPVYSDVEAVFSIEDQAGTAYTVIGLVPKLTSAELAVAGTDYSQFITDTYVRLPDSATQQTRDLANQIVDQAGAENPYDMAVAIQNYLRANFTYQIDAGSAPDGRDIVDYFLFESQTGRCDHYASSMTVMLRMLGIPARIVTGLAPVPFDNEMNGYVYRGRNAHAWVEVYFPGYGWIQFEPTPTQQSIDLSQTASEPTTTPEPTPTVIPTEFPQGTQASISPTPTATPLPAPATTDTDATSSNSSGVSRWAFGLAATSALLLGSAALLYWKRRNAFGGLPVASANYGRLQRLGRFLGVSPSPELTPREYATNFGAVRPQSATGAMRVADAYTQAQYATNVDSGTIERESEYGWREAKAGANDWRFWRRR